MKLFKNTSITTKLLVLVLPPAIFISVMMVIFVDLLNSTIEGAKTSLYDELYISSSTIINADRDFYQSAIAEKELVLSWDSLSQDERESLIDDFNENKDQVKDRITLAMNSLKSDTQLFNEYTLSTNGKTMSELEASFFTSFNKWVEAFDVTTNTGDLESRDSYFSAARDDINSMTELLDEYAVIATERISNEINYALSLSIRAVVIILAFLVLISVATIIYLRSNIRYITKISNKIADGQFNFDVDNKRFGKGEIGQLCRATGNILSRLNNYVDYIQEITSVLSLMAEGDMRIKLKHDYAGEFEAVKGALISISSALGNTLSIISASSGQVNTGASQVSRAAQSLAEGSVRQANAIDELSQSMRDIVQQVNDNTSNALSAQTLAVEAGDEVVMGNRHMKEMLSAMDAINSSSSEVSKIMKVIDDIAFQTNILALNAAVEAARAGSAGKGFAVVADEVRNLAGKSAEAATQTATLIQESVKAAEDGQMTAESTAKSLKLIEEKTLSTKNLVENIASASKTQSQTLEQIKKMVAQITDVVQTNAATAEESSAASEELNAQADTLNSEISKFKLP